MFISGGFVLCKVSVIIPVYNVEKYLDDCLQSVLKQDFDDMEILCVDDCSEDGSRQILERYAAKDSRIHIISYAKNGGLSYARNRAMEQAHGKYIYFLDSDDMMPESVLKHLYRIASEDRLDVLKFDFRTIYEDGLGGREKLHISRRREEYRGIYDGQKLACQMMKHGDIYLTAWSCLWSCTFLERHHLRFHEGILHEDVPFCFLAFLMAERIRYLSEPCYIYRRRADSITSKTPSVKNIEGWLAGFVDVMRWGITHRVELEEDGIRAVDAFLASQRGVAHRWLLQYGGAHPETLRFDDPDVNLALLLALRNGYGFVKGYLTETEQKQLRNEQQIVIYGAGQIGREIASLLEEYGIYNYSLAVTRKKENGGMMQMVHELGDFQDRKDSVLVVISVGHALFSDLEEEAKRQGFLRIVNYHEMM